MKAAGRESLPNLFILFTQFFIIMVKRRCFITYCVKYCFSKTKRVEVASTVNFPRCQNIFASLNKNFLCVIQMERVGEQIY